MVCSDVIGEARCAALLEELILLLGLVGAAMASAIGFSDVVTDSSFEVVMGAGAGAKGAAGGSRRVRRDILSAPTSTAS